MLKIRMSEPMMILLICALFLVVYSMVNAYAAPAKTDLGKIVIQSVNASMKGKGIGLVLSNTCIAMAKSNNTGLYPNYADLLTKYQATVSPQGKHITEDLVNCWALVCHNSTPSAVAPIEGIPAFITDDPSYSQGGDIANTDFSLLENPNLPDREQWIRKLAQCHWSFEDLRSGRCWAHMRQWVKVA